MADFNRAKAKNDNDTQNYSGDGQLPDLGCFELQQSGSISGHCCKDHAELPGCEGAASRSDNARRNSL